MNRSNRPRLSLAPASPQVSRHLAKSLILLTPQLFASASPQLASACAKPLIYRRLSLASATSPLKGGKGDPKVSFPSPVLEKDAK